MRELNDDWRAPKQKTSWETRGLKIEGKWFPLEALSTADLIQYLNKLRKKTKLSPNERRQNKFLGWIITWRNQDPERLPKRLRYHPDKWSLEELSSSNHPKNIHELSTLYRLAILRGSLSKINLLHNVLFNLGYVYKPPRYNNDTEEWIEDSVKTIGEWLDSDDRRILKQRGFKL